MTNKIARVCDGCGDVTILSDHAESTGMVEVQGDSCYLLLMRDIRKGESTRPTFDLSGKHFHPHCLLKALGKWLEKAE